MNRSRIAALAVVAGLAAGVHAGPPLELVVSSANTIPSEPGLTWAQGSNGAFNAAGIDANGNVAFRARILVGGPVTAANDNGLWYGGPWNGGTGTLAMKAREGSPCPGIVPDAMVSQFTVNNVGMSPAGHMWTGIQLLTGTGGVVASNDRLILTGQTGSLAPYLREGFPAAPSLPGVNVAGAPDSTTQDKRVNASGESVAFTQLAGTGIVANDNDYAIVAGAPGAQQVVVQRGAVFPGGLVINNFGNLFLNDTGNVLTGLEYRSNIAGVTTNNDGIAVTWIGGTLGVIAREGDPAHGMPAGVTYAPINVLGIPSPILFPLQPWNNQDHAIFIAMLAGAVTPADDTALYAWTGGTPTVIHREGDAAPDFAPLTLGAFDQFATRLNNQDQIAWAGTLVGGGVTTADDKVLYLTTIGGATTALYREGSPVPGLTGANFGNPVNIGINSAGWIVFETTMTGPSVTTNDDRALFARSPAGEYSLLVREGDTHFGVLVANWARNQDANGDGAASGFDDSGWLTFSVFSAGTTGVTSAVIRTLLDTPCYPDCNNSGTLTVADFVCFQGEFVAGNLAYADCNGSGTLTVADFICFQGAFVAGCP